MLCTFILKYFYNERRSFAHVKNRTRAGPATTYITKLYLHISYHNTNIVFKSENLIQSLRLGIPTLYFYLCIVVNNILIIIISIYVYIIYSDFIILLVYHHRRHYDKCIQTLKTIECTDLRQGIIVL